MHIILLKCLKLKLSANLFESRRIGEFHRVILTAQILQQQAILLDSLHQVLHQTVVLAEHLRHACREKDAERRIHIDDHPLTKSSLYPPDTCDSAFIPYFSHQALRTFQNSTTRRKPIDAGPSTSSRNSSDARQNVTDVLKLGPKYGIPFKSKDILIANLISDFEANMSLISLDRRNQLSNTDTNNVVRYDLNYTLQQDIRKLINFWKSSGYISEQLKRHLIESDCVQPRAYGLPKIHKPDGHTLPSFYKLVSLDVVSLFTNVPQGLAIMALDKRWPRLVDKVPVPLVELTEALKICFKASIFKFSNTNYAQTFGLPTGFPFSPILSDLAFNSYHSKLQFTIKSESQCQISFLDVSLMIHNRCIHTDWYHKDTWSQRYLNFLSHHPRSYKIGTINCLVNRAIRLSSPAYHNKNLSLIYQVLWKNNYPYIMLSKHIRDRHKSIVTPSDSDNNNLDVHPVVPLRFVSIPYVLGFFESLNRTFARYNIKFVGENKRDLSFLFDSGQTGRQLHTRVPEHRRNIHEHEDNYTALTRHSLDQDHAFNFDGPSVLAVDPVYYKRLLLEMCHIVANPLSVNLRSDIEHLSSICTPVILPS
ncbi:uncharacterized protein LOC124406229 [Diprion similis]|uniref:uncharacterized protein LOC124406229 n=1 Tax=Diprion similis TaxID=362088 RepID=UPI001EF76988|nr:uncharacterized protein LOC124406229 [Diprion similis]